MYYQEAVCVRSLPQKRDSNSGDSDSTHTPGTRYIFVKYLKKCVLSNMLFFIRFLTEVASDCAIYVSSFILYITSRPFLQHVGRYVIPAVYNGC